MTTKPTLTNAMIEKRKWGYNLILFLSIPCNNYSDTASLTFREVSGQWEVYTSSMSIESFAKLARIVAKLPPHNQIVDRKLPEFVSRYSLPANAMPAILKYAELVDYVAERYNDSDTMFEAFSQAFYHLSARSISSE